MMQDLVKEPHKWNLASDRKLFKALESFSGSIREKSSLLLEEVDNLNSDSVELECSFRNTLNEFLSLADTQFIENVRATVTTHLVLGNLKFCYIRTKLLLALSSTQLIPKCLKRLFNAFSLLHCFTARI